MTQEGWRELVLNAVAKHTAGDSLALDRLAQLLAEQDAAKVAFREKGYGVIGTTWPELVAGSPTLDRAHPEYELSTPETTCICGHRADQHHQGVFGDVICCFVDCPCSNFELPDQVEQGGKA